MFSGLPGGSPGPNAEASGRTLLFMVFFGVVAALVLGGMLFYAADAARMG